MPVEQRLILFEEDETVTALSSANRMAEKPFVSGDIISYEIVDNNQVTVRAKLADTIGEKEVEYVVPPEVLLEALIRFCIENNIRLPREGKKSIRYVNGRVAMNIRMGDMLKLAASMAELQPDDPLGAAV